MKYPKLIILYGRFGKKLHEKQQAMIEGRSTCMYREFAKKFGEIIYLCPQKTKEYWDSSVTDYREGHKTIEEYLKLEMNKDAIIWSVKHDPTGKKDEILNQLPNKMVYYSCCSYHAINSNCDISLVDTLDRVLGNGHLWVKGKDPEYWYPVRKTKLVDYLFIGRRGDKNEVWFINELTKQVRAERKILWIGGEKHQSKIKKTHHKVICTPFKPMNEVRDLICTARVGLILSTIPAEGFPQTFLEMSMVGLPVIYMGPRNDVYNGNNFILFKKESAVSYAEDVLSKLAYHPKANYRQYAIENYSLEKSYESILRGLECEIQ